MKTILSRVFEVELLFNDFLSESEIKEHLKKYSNDVYVEEKKATMLLSLPPDMNEAHVEVEVDFILNDGQYGELIEYFEV